MQCKRCLNKDPMFFYLGSKGYYCRKCIMFKRMLLEDDFEAINYQITDLDYHISYNFELTNEQKLASKKMLESLKKGFNVFLNCVCGAGKTEICLESISYFLSQKKKVCFAISRRQVVLELYTRFKNYFKNIKIVKICSGFTDELLGDLIICTTHQLYRFHQYFDLLILDEVDAYPFKNNEVLYNIALNSCKGNLVFSSATFLDLKLANFIEVSLLKRPHNKALAVPKLFFGFKLYLIFRILYRINQNPKQLIVFCPSKKMVKYFYYLLRGFISCQYVSSEHINDEIINNFRNKKLKVLFATTILERGVTFSNIDVMVFLANDRIFDCASLIQIAGRVGRDFNYPYGEVEFYLNGYNQEIKKCLTQIKKANLSLINETSRI